MLYLIGLGLNEKGYSKEAYDAIFQASKVYLESYTTEIPYNIKELEKQFKGKKFVSAGREFVEGLKFLDEAKKTDVVLLVYGSPLAATTHISIIQEARKRKIKTKVIHSASILDAVAETGLQPYKFGKIASMPNFNADSYVGVIKNNLKIKAHSLVLVDIGLGFQDAIKKLDGDCAKNGVKLDKVIICERLGLQKSHMYYDTTNRLRYLKIEAPFCIIIPGELHFMEREFLNSI